MIHNVSTWKEIRNHRIPPTITILEDRLYDILSRDDSPALSIEDAAPIVGMCVPSLRRWVQSGKCPFGMGWEGNKYGNGYSRISKLALWNWIGMK